MVNAKLVAVALIAGVGISTFVALSTTYHHNTDAFSVDSTVGDVCAEMDPKDMTEGVTKLCTDANDIPLFEEIGCGTEENQVTFTFGEIITSEDVQAAYDAVVDRCSPEGRRLGDGKKSSGRKLWNTNYGWCSMDFGFVVGFSGDTANYCNPAQGRNCNGNRGCGNALSSCCISHDQCLQSNEKTDICALSKVSGKCCDKKLSACAAGVNCWYKCGWRKKFRCYDWGLSATSSAVMVGMNPPFTDWSPQHEWNTGGSSC